MSRGKTLKFIMEFKEIKILKDFSVGGIAALYYIESLLTYYKENTYILGELKKMAGGIAKQGIATERFVWMI